MTWLGLWCLALPMGARGQEARTCDYHDPVWSPDSERLAFYSNRDGDFEVYTIRRDGTGLVRITRHEGNDGGPAWSPDGRRLVFTSDRGGAGTLYLTELSGADGEPAGAGGSATLVSEEAGPAGAPVWSRDGESLFYEGRRDGNRDIFAIDLRTRAITRLTDHPGNDFRAAPSPDGAWLAIQSNRSGRYQVYRLPAGGGEVEPLTSGEANSASPDWSPDGRRLVYFSDRDGNGDLYVLDLDTRSSTRLTTHEGDDYAPKWSPDGTTIAYTSRRSGESRIYLIDAAGAKPRLLVGGCGEDGS